MSDDLVAFVRGRLDEDEQVAYEAIGAEFVVCGRWNARGPYGDRDRFGNIQSELREQIIEDDLLWPHAVHIARHDPARVLAEIAAKRRRLARHIPERRRLALVDDTGETSFAFYVCTWCTPNRVIEQGQDFVEWPCPDVRDDAAPYAAHPDYRPEWAPEA